MLPPSELSTTAKCVSSLPTPSATSSNLTGKKLIIKSTPEHDDDSEAMMISYDETFEDLNPIQPLAKPRAMETKRKLGKQ